MSAHKALVVALVTMLAVACGGGEPAAQDPAPTPTPRPVPTGEPLAASEIPFAELDVGIAAVEDLAVEAGETVTVDYLVHNATADDEKLTMRVVEDTGLVPELSAKSLIVEGFGVVQITATFSVPDAALEGDEFTYSVLVFKASDAEHRLAATTRVRVIDVVGVRPVAEPNRAVTSTNERVIAYVVGNDTGRDIDAASVRIVGGAFRGAGVDAEGAGFIGYRPYENVIGTDAVLYEVCTTRGLCDTGVLTVTVERAD